MWTGLTALFLLNNLSKSSSMTGKCNECNGCYHLACRQEEPYACFMAKPGAGHVHALCMHTSLLCYHNIMIIKELF